MALYDRSKIIFGLAKESTRGTANDTISRYIAIDRGLTMDYVLSLIEDTQLRGQVYNIPPITGIKTGTGTIRFNVEAGNIGELLYSLLGNVTSEQQGQTSAYKHTFIRSNSNQLQSYTIHIDWGIAKKKYVRSCIKSITFSVTPDGVLLADISLLFEKEDSSTVTFNPSWSTPKPLMGYQVAIENPDGEIVTNVKDLSITIDNQNFAKRVLKQSQDIDDILAIGPLLVNGSFTVYFESLTERNNFLSNTASSLELKLEGQTIEGAYKETFDILLPEIHYTAYPFGEADGLLASAVTFNAYQKLSDGSNQVTVYIINNITSY